MTKEQIEKKLFDIIPVKVNSGSESVLANGRPFNVDFRIVSEDNYQQMLERACQEMQSQSGEQPKWLTLEQCQDKVAQEYGYGQFYVLIKGSSEERINEVIQKVAELYLSSKINHKWNDEDMRIAMSRASEWGFYVGKNHLQDKSLNENYVSEKIFNYLSSNTHEMKVSAEGIAEHDCTDYAKINCKCPEGVCNYGKFKSGWSDDKPRKAYLVKFVDPERKYPVSYIIDNNGYKICKPTLLSGKELTENQIVELFQKELL